MGSGHSTTLSRQLLGQQNVLATPFRHWGLKFCCNFLSSSLQFLYSIHRAFCRPSDHSVQCAWWGPRPRYKPGTGGSIVPVTLTSIRPPHLPILLVTEALTCYCVVVIAKIKIVACPAPSWRRKIRQIGFYILVGLSFWLTLVVPTNHNPSLCLQCVAK